MSTPKSPNPSPPQPNPGGFLTPPAAPVTVHAVVNGKPVEYMAGLRETLMDLLRREGWAGVKNGCETGECGACAVLMDGVPKASCLILAAQAEGRTITTIEGLGTFEALHPVQQAFVDATAIQCGFCTPAMVLVAAALLKENPHPTEADVRQAFDGVLCRCTGYVKPVEAVLACAARRPAESGGTPERQVP